MKVCLDCFNIYPEDRGKCPDCGSGSVRGIEAALPSGTLLAGRYALKGVLSAGSASYNYIADDSVLGTKAVIREYFPLKGAARTSAGIVSENRELFEAGCRIFAARTSACSHINESALYDVFRESGTVYSVRRYIDGITLKELISSGTCDKKLKNSIMRQIVTYITALHSRGCTHGAICPENIIVNSDGSIVITDAAAPVITGGKLGYAGMSGYRPHKTDRTAGISVSDDVYSVAAVCSYILSEKERPEEWKKLPPETDSSLAAAIDTAMNGNEVFRQAQLGIIAERLSVPAEKSQPDVIRKAESDMDTVEIASVDMNADKRTKNKRFRYGSAVCIAAAFILLASGVFIVSHMLSDKSSNGQTVPVSAEELHIPDLSGMTLEAAENVAAELGLKISAVDKLCSDDLAADMIMLQEPANGALCQKGDVIRVTVSAGKQKQMLTAPNYVGMPFEEAKAELEKYGIVVEYAEDGNSVLQNGIVTRQSFAGGSVINSGDTVKLWVSVNNNGFDGAYYDVPSFVGISADLISSVVGSEHFRYTFEYSFNSSYDEGVIYSQSLAAGGAPACAGTEINLYVSKGIETAVVPDTQYKSEEDACEMLRNAGFEPDIAYEKSDTVEDGHIISQNIAAGTSAAMNTVVCIVVSSGYPEEEYEAPEEEEAEEPTPATAAETVPTTVKQEPVTTAEVVADISGEAHAFHEDELKDAEE